MTLSLSEVQAIRFPIARRGTDGYRAAEVDDFVDKVVDTFTVLADDNERLKATVEALQNDNANTGQGEAAPADEQLRSENERLRVELEQARHQAAQASQGQGDDSALRGELDELRRQNAELAAREQDLTRQLEQAKQEQPAPGAVSTTSGNVERIEVSTSEQASPVVIRLVQLASEQAENLMSEAKAEAARTRAEAEKSAEETTSAAQAEAERIQQQARDEADRLGREAKGRADQVDVDATNRRAELFTELESERDEFQSKVDKLRSFENDYRTRLTEHFRKQAEAIEKGEFEPGEVPSLMGEERGQSSTPRLDALLAQKN